MEDEEQARWHRLMEARVAENLACQLRLARQYTRLYPRDVPGLCALADVLSKMRRYSDARSALCTALRIAARDRIDFVCYWIGHMYRHMGDFHRAEMWYKRALKVSPTTNSLVYLGTCVLSQGRFEEAEHLLRRAVEVASSKPDEAYYNLGITLRNAGRYDEALECFERAIELHPEYKLAKTARDDILQMKKIGGSIQPSRATEAASWSDGRDQSTQIGTHRARWCGSWRRPSAGRWMPKRYRVVEDEPKARWRGIMEAWAAGNLACRLRLARQYTCLYPHDVPGLCALADVLNEMRRYSEARAALCTALRVATREKALRFAARDRTDFVHAQIGDMYQHMSDYHRAEMWYRRAVKLSASTNNLDYLGTCVLSQGRFEEAEHFLRRAVEVASSKPGGAYYNLGVTLRNTGRYDEALECFERAIELDPEHELAKGARDDILQMKRIGGSIQPERAIGRGQSE